MTYEEIKKQAAAKVEEWCVDKSKLERFCTKAKEIVNQCIVYEEKYRDYKESSEETYLAFRKASEEYEYKKANKDSEEPISSTVLEEAEEAYKEAYESYSEALDKSIVTAKKEPSVLHPIIACYGYPTIGRFALPEFNNKNDALLVYYAGLIILHDSAEQRYVSIAGNIWSKGPGDLWHMARYAFYSHYGDKILFIKTALNHVEKDLRRIDEDAKISELYKESIPAKLDHKWSRPMKRDSIITALDFNNELEFNLAYTYGKTRLVDGNRRLWQIQLDEMCDADIENLRKP